MKSKQETFETMMQSFGYRYNLSTVFDDFLTMSLCALSQRPGTGKSYHEDLYLETVAKYTGDKLVYSFPELLALLVLEMEERKDSSAGNDVLGEFYELHLSQAHKAQHFTPWPVCVFMAKSLAVKEVEEQKVLRVLDPCCGSGRMLLAMSKEIGKQHEFYGIDIDPTCVKMTATNLFLNGLFHAEVLCADALNTEDFRVSYKTSLFPFGVFRIEQKEYSKLWNSIQVDIAQPPTSAVHNPQTFPMDDNPHYNSSGFGSQLQLF